MILVYKEQEDKKDKFRGKIKKLEENKGEERYLITGDFNVTIEELRGKKLEEKKKRNKIGMCNESIPF